METPTKNSASTEAVQNQVWREVGPQIHDKGVTYRVWALGRKLVVAYLERGNGKIEKLELAPVPEPGYFAGTDPKGKAGDLYKFSIDGGEPIPDFMSHYQPRGAMGPSMVVDAKKYQWQAPDWQRPAWRGQIVYECHIGTFTPGGTYLSTIERLDHLADLGITAVEFMPVAQSAGSRGWGYDGVMLFAPFHAYGTPDQFRTLIDACHLRGLAVILDVVFNHLGPEGNFSHAFSDYYFHLGKDNPWGQNFNLDGPNSEPVRTVMRQNISYWLNEFRIDGFRMDATHMVHDDSAKHLLAEAADIAHEIGGWMIAEDDRNSRMLLEPHEKGGWDFDAVWSDDYHHVMRVSQTHEQQHFYSMVKGTAQELAKVIENGWLYTGQRSEFHQANRGTSCADFEPEHFVFCISNHDQAGNRLLGDRFHQGIDGAGYRALSLFHCLIPYTPLLFMGQEWGATSPFLYFTDMSEELGILIAEGRRRDFLSSNFAKDENELTKMSHPQEIGTFLRSKLHWSEIEQNDHHRLLRLYRDALKWRRELFPEGNPPRDQWKVEVHGASVVIRYHLPKRSFSLCLNLDAKQPPPALEGAVLMRSNAESYSGQSSVEGIEAVLREG
jgi:maltooligosyltrehalose trehalohydrolase